MPGPSNLYGVAATVGFITATSGSLTGTAPAGVATDIMTPVTIAAPSSGYWYPIVYLAFYIGYAATLPSDLHVGFNLNGGSIVDQYVIDTALYVANTWIAYFPTLVGTPSNTAWAGAGSTIHITAQPFTNLVNIRAYSNAARIALYRALDQ